MRRYARLLAPSAHHRPFIAAVVGRLPISMGPLSVVLGVRAATGSYAIAGLVAAALAVGLGVGAPILGRLVDRVGQSRVVATCAVASGACMAALAVATTRGAATGTMVALAAGAGLAFPPLSPCMRAAWRSLIADPVDRTAAYALEAVAIEIIFISGPVLVGLLLLVEVPGLPLMATALAVAVGGTSYAATGAARDWRPDEVGPTRRRGTALRGRGIVVTLSAFLLVSIAFGTLDVSLAATAADELGNEALVGLLFTAIAGGSLVGGLWYGNRRFVAPQRTRLVVALVVFTTGLAPLWAAGTTLWVLLPLLFAAGVGIAPASIVSHQLLDDLAPPGTSTEAQAWSSTANTGGAAAGTALAGLLVELGGPSLSLAVAPLAVLCALALVLVARRRLTPVAEPAAAVA